MSYDHEIAVAPRNSMAPKMSMAPGGRSNNRVVINVGGIRFETFKSTLKNIPDTRLSWITETTGHNPDYDPVSREYFFDRHPAIFNMILNYYRTGKLHAPMDVCGPLFEEELAFWGIDEKQIEPCCWTTYRTHRDAQERLAQFDGEGDPEEDDDVLDENDMAERFGIAIDHASQNKNCFQRYRGKIWTSLEEPYSSMAAQVIAVISLMFVLLSIVAFCMESQFMFRESIVPNSPINDTWSVSQIQNDSISKTFVKIIEYVCVAYFTIEMTVRFIFCPSKMDYIKNGLNWVDFLSVIPFYINLIVVAADSEFRYTTGLKILNVLRVVRIFRILKLTRHVTGLKVLVHTVKASVKELMLLILVLFICVLIFACMIYYAEQIAEDDGNNFKDIPLGFWWAVVTMTTLGYGDMTPKTTSGYIVGAMCALCGVLTLALPVPVIVNNFTLYYSHVQARLSLPRKKRRVLVGAADTLKTQTIMPEDSFDEEENESRRSSQKLCSVMGSNASIKSIEKAPSDDSAVGSYDSAKSAATATDMRSNISVIFTDELAEQSSFHKRRARAGGSIKNGETSSKIRRNTTARRGSVMPGASNGDAKTSSVATRGPARKGSLRKDGRSRRQSFIQPTLPEVVNP